MLVLTVALTMSAIMAFAAIRALHEENQDHFVG